MRKLLLFLITSLLLTIPALSQDDSSNPAFVRAAHFAVDVSEVDIYINSDLTLEAVDFTTVSDWLRLEAGTYEVAIVPTGASIDEAVLSDTYMLNSDEWVTLAVIGEATQESLAIEVIVENLNNIPDESSFVNVVHAVTDLEPVTIFIDDIEIVSQATYLGDDTASAEGIVLESGEFSIDVQDVDGNGLLSIDPTAFEMGFAYLIAVVSTVDDLQVIIVPTDVDAMNNDNVTALDEKALARFGHFSVSASDVDIYLNDELFLEATQFGDVTDYIELAAGRYDVALVQTGEAIDNALYSGEIELAMDSITLVAVVGFIENDTLQVVPANEDNLVPDNRFARVAFFQSIPGINTFNVYANDNRLIQGVVYPSALGNSGDGYVSVDILAGAYEFSITATNISLDVGNVTVGRGRVYLVVATGTETTPIYFLISGDFPLSEED